MSTMTRPRINPLVRYLKDRQLTMPPRSGNGSQSPTPLDDHERLDNYTRQNGGEFLTARQERQITRMAFRNARRHGA